MFGFGLRKRFKGIDVYRDFIFCGVRFFSWKDQILSTRMALMDVAQRSRFVEKYHPLSFSKYKGCMGGKGDIVLLATGETLNRYRGIPGAIHIGVNRSFLSDKVPPLDFYFLQDISGASEYIDKAASYRQGQCVKFFGRLSHERCIIPWNYVEQADAKPYMTAYPYGIVPCNILDLDISELPDFGSVVFPAFSFALWMRPARIYLVGCDCSSQYFDAKKAPNSFESLIGGWKKMSRYVSMYYPDIDICSINPVGLKGIFRDIEL